LGGFGGSPYKARETGEAFLTLEKAMLLELVYPLTSAIMPMISDRKKAPKLFWLDAGLVNYAANIRKEYVISSDLMDTWRGKATKQMAAQELKALSYDVKAKRHFWIRAKRGSTAEVDLVYPFDGQLIPIEVKTQNHKTFRLINLPFYMISALPEILESVTNKIYSSSI
jgi:predicted AAA+ superfamily ATPase